jgi:hypothetical protein
VAFEVVHAEHRLVERQAEAAGDRGADQQRAGQAWALGVGDGVDVASMPAWDRVCSSSGIARRMWSREASSGTTPPYSSCMATCECSACDSRPRCVSYNAGRFHRRRIRRRERSLEQLPEKGKALL